MRRPAALLIVCVLALFGLTASSAPAKRGAACTWGASSVIVEQANGEYVQSEPVTTGCIPG
jgi:hypothetical protein